MSLLAEIFIRERTASWLGHGSEFLKRVCLDLLLPPRCLVCDTAADLPDGLCAACWSEMTFIVDPYCDRYGSPFAHDIGDGALSARAISDPPIFDRSRAPVVYDGAAKSLVTALKFGGRRELAVPMANLMMPFARQLASDDCLVVPVPLHPWRLFQRRFNQSAELGRTIARDLTVEFDPQALLRKKRTRQQVGLSSKDRQSNVRGAFAVRQERAGALLGRHVILIDDVLTSGATVSACTRALLKAGAAKVDVLTFAMVCGESL